MGFGKFSNLYVNFPQILGKLLNCTHVRLKSKENRGNAMIRGLEDPNQDFNCAHTVETEIGV